MKKSIYIFFLLFSLLNVNLFSQASIRDSALTMGYIKVGYAFHLPGLDMAERFGFNSSLGAEYDYKWKSGWMAGIQGNFLFGNQIREDEVLDPLRNEDGNITDLNGEIADVLMYERGFMVNLNAGYIFGGLGPNPNSGILLKAGLGFIQHKIRIEADRNPVPQIQGDYVKGYDRLSNGITAYQFAGYVFHSNKRLINFFVGLESWQGFTKNRRSFNYDQVKKEEGTRIDLLYGARIGWILPLYPRPPKEFYYF